MDSEYLPASNLSMPRARRAAAPWANSAGWTASRIPRTTGTLRTSELHQTPGIIRAEEICVIMCQFEQFPMKIIGDCRRNCQKILPVAAASRVDRHPERAVNIALHASLCEGRPME